MKHLLIITLILTSCHILELEETNKKINIPYNWKLEVNWFGSPIHTVKENMAYRLSSDGSEMIAINLHTGKQTWNLIYKQGFSNHPIIYKDQLISLSMFGDYLYFININSGVIEREVLLRKQGINNDDTSYNSFKPGWFEAYLEGDILIWPPNFSGHGILKLNLITDIITEENQEVGELKVLYTRSSDYHEKMSDTMYIENGNAYFATRDYNWNENGHFGKFISLNIYSGEINWITTSNTLYGWLSRIYPHGGNLFISDMGGYTLLNKKTGEKYYEVTPGNASITKKGFIMGNKFFVADSHNNSSDNLECINMDTGEQVWGSKYIDHSLGNSPVVYDDILFLPAQDGLYYFDATNGKYLNMNSEIDGGGNQMGVSYIYNEDTFIMEGEDIIYSIDLKELSKRIRD